MAEKTDDGIKKAFKSVRQALEEHLSGINENTAEIQTLFDYIQAMENKIEKLSQRMDELQLQNDMPLEKKQIAPLNQMEKKVFLVLYTEEIPMSYKEIAEKAQLPLATIPETISSLMGKGIPLARKFCNNQTFMNVDNAFKEMQAKENLINLSLDSFM